MLVHTDRAPAEVDPATVAPLCDEAEFTELVDEMVAEEAPRVFAVVQEYGERVDGRIAAWGLAFEDYTEVVGVDHDIRMSRCSLDFAARAFSRRPHITARLVWVNPEARTQPEVTKPPERAWNVTRSANDEVDRSAG